MEWIAVRRENQVQQSSSPEAQQPSTCLAYLPLSWHPNIEASLQG
jgi:hypothetical protein